MTTPQNDKLSGIIGSVSKFAGTLVGTAVVAGKQIIGSVTPSSESSPDKPGRKTIQAPAQKKRKVARKTKKKKKKVVKRKPTGSSGKSGVSKKKHTLSPAKKKKGVTPKKKTTPHNRDAKTSGAD